MSIEKFIQKNYPNQHWDEAAAKQLAIDYARYHVREALLQILEDSPTGSSTDIFSYEDMKDAILNAYPLEKIK